MKKLLKKWLLKISVALLPCVLVIILILSVLFSNPQSQNELAASADDPERLRELMAISEFGIPADIVFMVTTMLCKDDDELLTKPFIFVAMEFMEVTETVRVMKHVGCSEDPDKEDDDSDDGEGNHGAGETETHSSCKYVLANTNTYLHKDSILSYLGEEEKDDTGINAKNILEKLQAVADKKSQETDKDDTRSISIAGIPDSPYEPDEQDAPQFSEYILAIERCGIKNKNDIKTIIDLHESGYFTEWIESSAESFGIEIGTAGSGPFVTGSNGSHSHIRNLLQNDDSVYEGGAFQSPLDGGWREKVFCEFGGYRGHTGIDFGTGVTEGMPIYSVAAGTVLYVSHTPGSYNGYNAYGIHVVINHGGKIVTMYAHCSQAYVTAGEQIEAGQLIAALGNTGNSTGKHLHFEVIVNGVPKNPRGYLT